MRVLLLELPLERGVNPAAWSNSALRNACKNGYIEIFRLLLEPAFVEQIK